VVLFIIRNSKKDPAANVPGGILLHNNELLIINYKLSVINSYRMNIDY